MLECARNSRECYASERCLRLTSATLNRIRQIIAVNLPLGLIVVVIGGSGRPPLVLRRQKLSD